MLGVSFGHIEYDQFICIVLTIKICQTYRVGIHDGGIRKVSYRMLMI